MTAPLVVLGWGNPSRGDDALGPLFCARLMARLDATGRGASCDVLEDFQLQIEHAIDLVDRQLVLFVDAEANGDDPERPFSFRPVTARRDLSHTTHALSPEAVLAVFEQVHGTTPPPAFVLAVHGKSFELGEALSPEAASNLEAAWVFADRLIEVPDPQTWATRARQAG